MIKNMKLFLTVCAVAGVLSACSSNNEKDNEVMEATPTPVATPMVDTMDEQDPTDEVGNVFYFEFDSSVLTSEARSALTVWAQALKDNPENVRLEGHADERGSREYNMALGERRSNAVRDFLVLQGVDSSNIETVSYGEERPVEFGSFESAWSKNRRVEIKY